MIFPDFDETAACVRWDEADLFRYVFAPDDPQLESPRQYFRPPGADPGRPVLTLSYDVIIADGELEPRACGRLAGRAAATALPGTPA